MSSNNPPESAGSRRGHLLLAASYAKESWFPQLSGAAERLVAILQNPGGVDRDALVSELKRDLSVISALASTMVADGSPVEAGIGTLRDLPPGGIEAIVRPESLVRSKHDISLMTDLQSARLEESMVSVAAAETLSSAYNVESELAYTCALLRQLGLSLLAWNYPHVFKRAFSIIRPGETFDATIGKVLGFTPTLLTLTLLRSAKASPVILRTIGDSWINGAPSEREITLVDKLTSLCRVSEALARATSRNAYPTSSADWDHSKQEIETRIGRNGWRILEAELQWYLASYQTGAASGISVPKLVSELSEYARINQGEITLFERNEAAQRCDEGIKRLFKDFYLRLASVGVPQTEAVQFLLGQVVRRSGFSFGALFTRGSGGQTFDAAYCSPGVELSEISSREHVRAAVKQAAQSKAVVHGGDSAVPCTWMAAIVGETQRGTVLYVESPQQLASEKRSSGVFKAVGHAVSDALALY